MTHQIVQKKEKWVAAVTYWLRYETRKYPNADEPNQRSIKDSLDGNDGKFWEVSEHVLNRIETPSYMAGRPAFSQYLEDNPWSARRKEINIFRCQQ